MWSVTSLCCGREAVLKLKCFQAVVYDVKVLGPRTAAWASGNALVNGVASVVAVVLASTAGISLGCNPLCMARVSRVCKGQARVLKYAPLDGCTQCGRLQKENHA